MLKKFLIITLLMFNISACNQKEPAAVVSSNSNVAVINAEKIRNETKAGQSIAKQLNDLQAQLKDKVAKLTKDFDAKKQDLDKQKAILNKDVFAKKEVEFNAQLDESRKMIQQEAAKLEQMQQDAVNEFNTIARQVIDDIVKESKYMHVFPSEVVIYADPKSDITSQVIAGIDKKTDVIKVKEPMNKDLGDKK